jgi:hypothetical protein
MAKTVNGVTSNTFSKDRDSAVPEKGLSGVGLGCTIVACSNAHKQRSRRHQAAVSGKAE